MWEGVSSKMISKELKNLSRRELVDIIYQMKKNEQQMQGEIAALQEQLQDKRIRLSEAGSISEAAVSVSNVFSAAQTAADLYLQEIACMKEDAAKECAQMINEANKTVERIFAKAKEQYTELSSRYQLEYEKLQKLKSEVKLLGETR